MSTQESNTRMTTNELMLAKAFRDAGFEQEKAENLAQSIFDAIRDNVATKSDLQRVELALRRDIQVLQSHVDSDIQVLQGHVDTRFAKVEGDVTLMKWMPGFILAFEVAIFWRVFGH
jgi:hypothetical protein